MSSARGASVAGRHASIAIRHVVAIALNFTNAMVQTAAKHTVVIVWMASAMMSSAASVVLVSFAPVVDSPNAERRIGRMLAWIAWAQLLQ